MKLLPLGVDTKTFTPARRSATCRRQLGVRETDTLLLFAGRYRSEKRVDLLLSALPHLLRVPTVHVVFAGTGPLADAVQHAASLYDRVHDLGYVSDKSRLADVYASADAFLSPGSWETFGFGICEALASGVPVVSADGGAGAEMLTGLGCGSLFTRGDAADLARAALARVGRSKPGAALAAARSTLETGYQWDRVFEAYVDHVQSLHQRRHPGAPLGA
jgi:alpha-1,6-mannosyltransferase